MKTKLRLSKVTLALVMCFCMFLACITGASILLASAASQLVDDELEFTSYTTIMAAGEDFQFAVLVNGEESDEVEWTSSNYDVVDIDETGYAIAYEAGYATITATVGELSVYVDVTVLDEVVHVEEIVLSTNVLEMIQDSKTRIGYTILPSNATEQGVTWKSSDESVATVNENGYVTAVAAGEATITATSNDGISAVTATCDVTVYADLEEATLTPATLTLNIGENKEFLVNLPDGVEADYRWYSSEDSVASVDVNDDETGTIFGWSFGSASIYVIATATNGDKYMATGNVLVTADYFYLTGLEGNWDTYAEEADVPSDLLLVEDAEQPGLYTITREFWAFDGFQIIHSGMDDNWTTKITPDWYNYEGSTDEYVANADGMFMVNALGSYTVALDLTEGRAKVSIIMRDLTVTTVELSVAEDSMPYLQKGVNETIVLDVKTYPETAPYVVDEIVTTVSANAADYVDVKPVLTESGALTLVVSLLEDADPADPIAFTLTCTVENGTDAIDLTILKEGDEYVAVTSITFEDAPYTINVNNGAKEWRTAINAYVNEDASVQGVIYSTDETGIYIEYEDDVVYVRASALGTFTIRATAVGNSEIYVETTVYVYSENGFYLIGLLKGEAVNGWTSLIPEVTSLEGTAFADWALASVGAKTFEGEFTLFAGDQFSIAFLGMNGNWDGVINNTYMNWADSEGTYWNNGINIEITQTGKYTITLDLSADVPSFTINFEGAEEEHVEYNLYLYIVRAGDNWNSSLSEEGNILATVGYIHMVDGVAESVTLTLDAYDFFTMDGAWPTIQFVTAKGTDGGYFVDATWYGSSYNDVTFSGGAFSAAGESGHFTNGGYGAQLWWSGAWEGNMTVEFNFTFDESGVLTAVVMNFVTAE